MSSNFVKRFLGPMLLGIILGTTLNVFNDSVTFNLENVVKFFYTITYNYTNVLLFIAPIMIFIYVVNGLNNLSGQATKFLKRYVVLLFASLVALGLITLFISYSIIPLFIQEIVLAPITYVDPFYTFVLDLPPLFNIPTALFLAIFMGLLMKRDSMFITLTNEVEQWLNTFMLKIMLPLMPIWIFGTFLRSGFMSQGVEIIINDILLSLLVLSIQFIWLFVMTYLGSKRANVLFKKALKALLKVFFEIVSLAGMGTGIIIPISIEQQTSLNLSADKAKIIASSNFNMPGSLVSNIVFATGIIFMFDLNVGILNLIVYVFFLIITLIAAPSVPGSVFTVTSTILSPLLGFDAASIDLMGGLYYKQGTSNSATNHSADIYFGLFLDNHVK